MRVPTAWLAIYQKNFGRGYSRLIGTVTVCGASRPPVRAIAIAELRWHYDLPWWTSGDYPVPLPATTADASKVATAWFKVHPADVIASPRSFPRHAAKIGAVELDFPLHVLWRRDRWLILDGIHRLVRADVEGHTSVQAVTLSIRDAAMIAGVE